MRSVEIYRRATAFQSGYTIITIAIRQDTITRNQKAASVVILAFLPALLPTTLANTEPLSFADAVPAYPCSAQELWLSTSRLRRSCCSH
ncbi:hypothetical protein PSPO01_07264 [Paraphaeosphaeria sporulosa]